MSAVNEMLVHFDRRRINLLEGLQSVSWEFLANGLRAPFTYSPTFLLMD
jgi:hypothetical protein